MKFEKMCDVIPPPSGRSMHLLICIYTVATLQFSSTCDKTVTAGEEERKRHRRELEIKSKTV